MTDKVIVSNDSALSGKYGARGFGQIQAAIQRHIVASKSRGLDVVYIAVDNAQAMAGFGAGKVNSAGNQKENKAAIDALFSAIKPDYLMILGAPDVVPHQDLQNPVADPRTPFAVDPDSLIPSDLPYACSVAWSDDPRDFIAPNRVVGRLPDLLGAKDPTYLINVLDHATRATPIAGALRTLGISTQSWQSSTTQTLQKLFGAATVALSCPTDGPSWLPAQLNAQVHFINCHGALSESRFFGEPGPRPVAHDAAHIAGKIPAGTIAAVECCYGAHIYDPTKSATGVMGICNTYLDCGASGYFGSTTIAFGPAVKNAYADCICRFFLQEVMAGRSIGAAALAARLTYAGKPTALDPVDLKTLAQFVLLGDPALHPLTPPTPMDNGAIAHSLGNDSVGQQREARRGRRKASEEKSSVLDTSQPVAHLAIDTPADMISRLESAAKAAGVIPPTSIQSFSTRIGRGSARAARGMAAAESRARIHVGLALPVPATDESHPPYPVAVIMHEDDGVTQFETAYGKSEGTYRHDRGAPVRYGFEERRSERARDCTRLR